MTSSVEIRRAKMAQLYSKLRVSFRSRLKSLVDEHAADKSLSIWMLTTAIFSANGSQVSINNLNDTNTPTYPNLRFKYLHVQSYANLMNLNQLNVNVPPTSEEEETTPTTNNQPFELITNLIDPNQANIVAVSKQHIHSWFAVNPFYKSSVPLVSPKKNYH